MDNLKTYGTGKNDLITVVFANYAHKYPIVIELFLTKDQMVYLFRWHFSQGQFFWKIGTKY